MVPWRFDTHFQGELGALKQRLGLLCSEMCIGQVVQDQISY